jgi:hypothetical protein
VKGVEDRMKSQLSSKDQDALRAMLATCAASLRA